VSKFIEPSLLLFLSKGSSYGYDLIEKLKELGFHKGAVDVGGVYRVLRKLEKDGYVRSFWAKTPGQKRKRYYDITPQGIRLLDKWTGQIKERRKALSKFVRIYHQD
jgi:DNA-binding PadR family transcriptional regulator